MRNGTVGAWGNPISFYVTPLHRLSSADSILMLGRNQPPMIIRIVPFTIAVIGRARVVSPAWYDAMRRWRCGLVFWPVLAKR